MDIAILGVDLGKNSCSVVGLGVGLSTLCKWVSIFRPADLVAAPQADLARENERLRLENRVLKEERDILKKLPSSSRARGREVRVRGELAASLAG